jgi:hypothetical protein
MKRVSPCSRRRHQGMSRTEKMNSIRSTESSDLIASDAPARYDVPQITYCRRKRDLKTVGVKGVDPIPARITVSHPSYWLKIEV